MSVSGIGDTGPARLGPQLDKKTQKGTGFTDFVKQAVRRVNEMEGEADQKVEQLAKGNAGIDETMISMQKMDISFRLLLQIRNKALEAYREIMRMQF